MTICSSFCAVENCEREVKARGLCASHYVKYWKSEEFVFKPDTILGEIDTKTLNRLSGFLEEE